LFLMTTLLSARAPHRQQAARVPCRPGGMAGPAASLAIVAVLLLPAPLALTRSRR
jgi:hypothetical protein